MARVLTGSHSFTCTPRVYPLTEWTTPAFRIHYCNFTRFTAYVQLWDEDALIGFWVRKVKGQGHDETKIHLFTQQRHTGRRFAVDDHQVQFRECCHRRGPQPAACVSCAPRNVIANRLQILLMDTRPLCGSWSAAGRIRRQLMWQGPFWVGLHEKQ